MDLVEETAEVYGKRHGYKEDKDLVTMMQSTTDIYNIIADEELETYVA